MRIFRVIVTALGAVTAVAVLGRRKMENDGTVAVVLPKKLYQELSKEGGPLDLPGVDVFPESARARQSVVERSAENETSSATAPCGQPNIIVDPTLINEAAVDNSPEAQSAPQATPTEEEVQQAVAAHYANQDTSQSAQ